jgi:hypothetical protein
LLKSPLQPTNVTAGSDSEPKMFGIFYRLQQAWQSSQEQLQRIENRSNDAANYGLMNQLLLDDFIERSLLLQGRHAATGLAAEIETLSEAEFRVFSQWGEDGIVEWLVNHLDMSDHRFIEFGVESFREANCRFLLQHRNWRGLVMDSSEQNMAALRKERLFWMHDLTAKAAFIARENINDLIVTEGFAGPLGILSIDLDGNDYWVWKAINCVNPAIVICEYNPILGDQHALAVPYDAQFQRFSAHYSGLYFGCSIAALRHLAEQKGYTFVGTNSNGINAFFVRNDLGERVLRLIRYVKAFPSRHRDSRDRKGQLSFVRGQDRFRLIQDMPVVDVRTGETILLRKVNRPFSDEWARETA